MLLILFQSIDV